MIHPRTTIKTTEGVSCDLETASIAIYVESCDSSLITTESKHMIYRHQIAMIVPFTSYRERLLYFFFFFNIQSQQSCFL